MDSIDSDDVDSDYLSEEFYVASDRQSLLDSDLANITISLNEKTISVKATGDGQTRNATLKKRADNSRRPRIPDAPRSDVFDTIGANQFEELLRQVSCSAQVRETKTEEDMKVNQIHFYKNESSATSVNRFCGSLSVLAGLSLDLSIISADVPALKVFCSKFRDQDIILFQDKTRLHISDKSFSNVLSFSRVQSNKPSFSILSADGFATTVHADRDKFSKAMKWATMTIEGTQRLTVKTVTDDGGAMLFFHGNTEISRFPVEILEGEGVNSDFPVLILEKITSFVDSEKIRFRFGHKALPTMLEISDPEVSEVNSRHFLQSMVVREKTLDEFRTEITPFTDEIPGEQALCLQRDARPSDLRQ